MTSTSQKQPLTIPPVVTEIGKRATIKALNLVRCNCEVVTALPPGEPVKDVTIGLRGGGSRFQQHPKTIVCAFGADVSAIGPEPAKVVVAKFSCDYAVQYEFEDEAFFDSLSEQDMSLFAAFNTSFHVWPHVREFVQSMAFRMTIPPVLLPMFRPLEMIGNPEQWQKLTASGQQ
jgi:hypothetical protein